MYKLLAILPMITLATAVTGCSEDPPPKSAADVDGNADAWVAYDTNADGEIDFVDDDGGTINIERRIAQVCEIPTPKFAFDSARLRDRAEPSLDDVAVCFGEDGPLRDEKILLVGRADPRGPEGYNLALGQRRAGSVAQYLIASGIPQSRIETSSRGEIDADGYDQATWADDRRVDIRIR